MVEDFVKMDEEQTKIFFIHTAPLHRTGISVAAPAVRGDLAEYLERVSLYHVPSELLSGESMQNI